MSEASARMVASARRRWQAGLGVLRSLATTIALVGLCYLLPLDHLASVPLAVILVVGLQSVGEHQLVFWPSAGLAPPVAAAPLAAPGLASRLPPRREFGDKLAKVSP